MRGMSHVCPMTTITANGVLGVAPETAKKVSILSDDFSHVGAIPSGETDPKLIAYKQLTWKAFCAGNNARKINPDVPKHDFRNDGLTVAELNEFITSCNAITGYVTRPEKKAIKAAKKAAPKKVKGAPKGMAKALAMLAANPEMLAAIKLLTGAK
jgi:hypothetical protein